MQNGYEDDIEPVLTQNEAAIPLEAEFLFSSIVLGNERFADHSIQISRYLLTFT